MITSRADTDAVNATGHLIIKVHIGPQFEYIIYKRFIVFKTPFHSAHHALKLIKSQQVKQATTRYPIDQGRRALIVFEEAQEVWWGLS